MPPLLYPLERANEALGALRAGAFDGAAVLVPPPAAAPQFDLDRRTELVLPA